jgi:hypothetical protein
MVSLTIALHCSSLVVQLSFDKICNKTFKGLLHLQAKQVITGNTVLAINFYGALLSERVHRS